MGYPVQLILTGFVESFAYLIAERFTGFLGRTGLNPTTIVYIAIKQSYGKIISFRNN